MKSLTIQQLQSIKQDATEGIFTMKGLSLTRLLHTLIREYGHYSDGSYSVDPSNFSLSDKKLILSHVIDSGEYEYACASPIRTETIFNEHISTIQNIIDDECYVVYCEDMEEAGMTRCTHPNNDEVYWVRRA